MGGNGGTVEVDETFIGNDRTKKPHGEKKGRGYAKVQDADTDLLPWNVRRLGLGWLRRICAYVTRGLARAVSFAQGVAGKCRMGPARDRAKGGP